MKLYLASLNLWVFQRYRKLFPDSKLNILRSFGVLNSEDYAFCVKYRDEINSMILDSGTWTLNNAKIDKRKILTVNNYMSYAKFVESYYDNIANFDSNFTPEGFENNYYNQLLLEEAGLRPFPVTHDIYGGEIDVYLERGYDYIALGSSQITSFDDLAHVMERFEGTGVKIHLFGSTKFEFLTSFPIYSCDSAMWAKVGSYGDIQYWNPKKEGANKTDKIYMEEFLHADAKKLTTFTNYEFQKDLIAYLKQELGITYQDLMGPDASYFKMLVNTHYFVKLEERVNRIHKEKGFI